MPSTIPNEVARLEAGPRDFSLPVDAGRSFTIDGDIFYVVRALGIKKLRRLAALAPQLGNLRLGASNLNDEDFAEVETTIATVMRILLRRDSADLFVSRLLADDAEGDGYEPLDAIKQALPAMMYAMEALTGRPLSPSAPSSTTPTDGDSRDGVTAEESTPIVFPLDDSSG
jgi:hypothetical protein